MAAYELRQTAYVKLVLHALKHTTCAVNGVLIGRVEIAGDDGKSTTTVEVTDCVPLFHGQLGLLPMLELALSQVDEHLATGKDSSLQIVGYYHANEQFDNYELSSVAKKIGDHIARHCPQAGILLLDNRQLGALAKGNSKAPVVQLYVRDGSSWRLSGPGGLRLKDATANSILSDYIKEERERRVVDFDDHLDDVSKDWLNPTLFN